MTPESAQAQREAHAETQGRISELFKYLNAIELPAYEHSKCSNDDWHDLRYVEDGYMRWPRVEEILYDNGFGGLAVYSDGWDDMSEDGRVSWLACLTCGLVWAVPEDLEWT